MLGETQGEQTMKSLAITIDGSENDANSLRFAAALARGAGMSLTVYHKLGEEVIVGSFDVLAIPIDNSDSVNRARRHAAEAFAAETAELPAARFVEVDTDPATLVRTLAVYHDLLLIERVTDAAGPDGGNLNAMLWDAHSPVIVTPPTLLPGRIEKIAVAWNASLPAAHALKSALHLFGPDKEFVILTRAGTEKDEELARYLACHGCQSVKWRDYGSPDLSARGWARALLAVASEEKADLLAAGAHGGFLNFGRATAKLATAATMPVMLAA